MLSEAQDYGASVRAHGKTSCKNLFGDIPKQLERGVSMRCSSWTVQFRLSSFFLCYDVTLALLMSIQLEPLRCKGGNHVASIIDSYPVKGPCENNA